MDETKLTALQKSLDDVRQEVRRALTHLDDRLARLAGSQRVVEIEVETVRNTAYEALAEVRHVEKQLRNDDE